MRENWTVEDILILVKAYPTPSQKHIESSCTAGITRQGEWLRLHPVPWRMLDSEQQFRKYQWIRAKIKKSTDPRPESHYIEADSIVVLDEHVPTTDNWSKRYAWLEPLRSRSIEQLKVAREQSQTSLGLVRPRVIERLEITPASSEWTADQLAVLRQESFFDKQAAAALEKIPFEFRYRYYCDDPECKGHKQLIVDWELHQSYRRWRNQYGDSWEEKLRQRYEEEMLHRYDTHFFVGTIRSHPGRWIIIGLFYPEKSSFRQGVLIRDG
jgi:hypothetical protein